MPKGEDNMDFLKTLLVYMSMTMAASMQGGTLPEPTPTPTTPPAAVVSTAAPATTTAPSAPVVTLAGTAATATPTPVPKPDITPNPNYRNLSKGDRGDRVKKLQERLIELGYLAGTADGSYGNQTRRAVMRFQYYNGLQQDGVAGRATQTVLFEYENVMPYPASPTPAASEAPLSSPTSDPVLTLAPLEAVTTAGTQEIVLQDATPEPVPALDVALTPLEGGSVTLNGTVLTLLSQQGNVSVSVAPHMFVSEDGDVYLSITDLCTAIPAWTLTTTADEAGQAVHWNITANGHTVTAYTIDGGFASLVDGVHQPFVAGDLVVHDNDLLVRTSYLHTALSLQVVYDDETNVVELK